jgi:hypothetical protein
MNDRVEEIDDERGDHRQQHVQAHVLFLTRRLPLRPAHDVESGSITPCEKRTNPANRPKTATKRRNMVMFKITLRLLLCDPIVSRSIVSYVAAVDPHQNSAD